MIFSFFSRRANCRIINRGRDCCEAVCGADGTRASRGDAGLLYYKSECTNNFVLTSYVSTASVVDFRSRMGLCRVCWTFSSLILRRHGDCAHFLSSRYSPRSPLSHRLAFMYPVGPSNGCVTQVVPMLNIDGVVEGNKRCNIRGKSHALKYTRCASEVTVGVEIVLAHWIM